MANQLGSFYMKETLVSKFLKGDLEMLKWKNLITLFVKETDSNDLLLAILLPHKEKLAAIIEIHRSLIF